jgi:uncharacterized paraquat-inducible protein A
VALITCPDCNKPMSERAAACPNCGAPSAKAKATSTTRAGGKWEAVGFLMMLAAFGTGTTQTTAGFVLSMILLPVGFLVFLIGRFK